MEDEMNEPTRSLFMCLGKRVDCVLEHIHEASEGLLNDILERRS
jgi:hypothetical protein